MNKETTIENKLVTVSKFMGYEAGVMPSTFSMPSCYRTNDYSKGWTLATYHTDYNELMLVWFKFNDLNIEDTPEYGKHRERIANAITEMPIKSAFDELYSAILWLNEINKTK